MFAIVTATETWQLILYGPFTSVEAAGRYARFHKLNGIVQLHDSGDAMDA